MIELAASGNGWAILVKAKPGARRDAVVGEHGGALKIAVAAPPERGRANESILRVLSEGLGVPRSALELLRGETSRYKVVRISGVERTDLERRRRRHPPPEVRDHLAQAEEVEVIDDERGEEHETEAAREDGPAQCDRARRPGVPHDRGKRLPRRVDDRERDARQEDVRAALDRFGNDSRPHPLERRPCHRAVLDGEQNEQEHIRRDGIEQRLGSRRV